MIIITYHGVGELFVRNEHQVRLDPENFEIDGARDPNWYKICCKIALHLHQNYINIVAPYDERVCDYLKEIANDERSEIYIIYPKAQLKDEWIGNLKDRYERTGSDYTRNAYLNALNFDKDIAKIENSGFTLVPIENVDDSPSTLLTMKRYNDAMSRFYSLGY